MIELKEVTMIYSTRKVTVKALNNINIQFDNGDFIALYGKSGSGKTTLLMTIATILRPTAGSVIWDGKNLYHLSQRERTKFRANNIGFIFQMFHLVPYLNVTENILLAAQRAEKSNYQIEIKKLVDQFALTARAYHKPCQLSAGEKQRVAIARALVNSPQLILADEPASNLDTENADIVFNYLSDFHKAGGTVVMATQKNEAKQFANRILKLDNGYIVKS